MITLFRLTKYFFPLILCCFLLNSCKSGKKATATENTPVQETTPVATVVDDSPSVYVSGEGTWIRATVIAIDESLDTNDPESPCSKVPCNATVRIDKVLQRGNDEASLIAEGTEITIRFRFTLALTTPELFPNLKTPQTGLNNNDRFEANLNGQLGLGTNNMNYHVFQYYKLN